MEVAMNGAQRRAEMQRLQQAWQDKAAQFRDAIETMRRVLPADQTVAVDTARIEEMLGTASAPAAPTITLPSFAMRV
jgi:hypothetical protein